MAGEARKNTTSAASEWRLKMKANHLHESVKNFTLKIARSARISFTNAAALTLPMVLAAATTAFAQTESVQFESHDHFMQKARSARFTDFAVRRDTKVKDEAAFGQMHYDCVPLNEQPSLRTYHLSKTADLPPQEMAEKAVADEGNVKPGQLTHDSASTDAFGNSTHCEAGQTPLVRTTLDQLSRFPTLQDFYRKMPGGAVAAAQAHTTTANADPQFADPAIAAHKYSVTYQYVNNWGGNSNLNIWAPYVNTSLGEIFSLSQEWYVGGTGSGLQSEEVGWVVYPAMFGDEKPHFFIYSTAANYAAGSGCWNNTCNDFVQVADFGLLGNAFTTVSTYGGTQYDFSAEYYFYQGNWWLSYQGTWIGYYPGSKYHGGQNTKYAQLLEFGSESVGTTIWPSEGSGQWPSTGGTHAAYQRNLWYVANTSTYATYWDTLTRSVLSPACYSIAGPYSSSSAGWQVYFYEGGPGGSGC